MFRWAVNFITVFPALKETPPGCQHICRPKTRAKVCEDLHRLLRCHGLAWDDLWKLKQEGISNGELYGFYNEDLEMITRQMDKVLALQKEFRNTSLVDFRMPQPSPPAPITTLPPLQDALRHIRVPKILVGCASMKKSHSK
ncbi:hypothetical protein K438DRAFT_1998844 [Mycena galopus ATCC 62051]|nr:hypothetical protein K438DRAFT_1998844 [Mycena galopus ATCC 62051]